MSANSNTTSSKSLVMAFAAGAAAGAILLARMTRQPKQDPAKKAELHLYKVAEYSLTAGLIRVCDRLKLYDALWESGPSTAAELAAKLHCNERWLTEILSQATAAGICVYFFGKFCLKPEYAHLLRDPEKAPRSIQGLFDMVPCLLARTDATIESIKSGMGVDYDFNDGAISVAIDRKNANWFKAKLKDDILSKVKTPKTGKSLLEMLEEGIQVADIGVGLGASTIAMAQQFPKCHFCAFETSQKSLEKIQERVQEAKLTNVTVYNAATRSLKEGPPSGEGQFDFIYVHDVVHDMSKPKLFLKDAKKSLAETGCMVIVDVSCFDNLKENISRPEAALLYGFSSFLSLASSTSVKGGSALGICGFSESLASRWMKEEGFEYFETLELESLDCFSCFVVA